VFAGTDSSPDGEVVGVEFHDERMVRPLDAVAGRVQFAVDLFVLLAGDRRFAFGMRLDVQPPEVVARENRSNMLFIDC